MTTLFIVVSTEGDILNKSTKKFGKKLYPASLYLQKASATKAAEAFGGAVEAVTVARPASAA